MKSRALALCVLLAAGPRPSAGAEPLSTPVRVGDHGRVGRVVFDLPDGATFKADTVDSEVRLAFVGAGVVQQPLTLPRHVLLVRGGQDMAAVLLARGAQGRVFRLDNRVVVDVTGPADRPAAPAGPAVAEPPAVPRTPTMVVPVSARREMPRPIPLADRPARPAAAPEGPAVAPTPPVLPSAPVAGTLAAAPSSAVPPPLVPPPVAPVTAPVAEVSWMLRAAPDVGAAAFRRGDAALVVLDRRLPPQALADGATWQQGATGTVVRLPVPPDAALRLERLPAGWKATAVPGPLPATLSPEPGQDGTRLPAPRVSAVVTVADPDTGGTLLVGTVLDAGPQAAVPTARRTPDMTLLPTWLGVAVASAADRVDLHATTRGFLLTGDAPGPVPPGTVQTRRFDLANAPAPELLNRLHAQQAGAAAAEPRARTHERTAAARTMLALGMGAEAQSLLQVVSSDDPQAASDAEVSGLTAVGAVLAGRPEEAAALDDPRLDGTDEISLWRGLRDRRLGRATPDAERLGRFAPLALSYPEGLKHEVWGDVAEAAVEQGAPVPRELLPPYARALALEHEGKVDEALAAYDALAAGRDRLGAVRGAARAVELRLAAGRIEPRDASVALERVSFGWRGDARELGLRLRIAELRAQGGNWREALAMLRDAATVFPDSAAAIRAGKAAVLQSMLAADGAGLSALDTVLLAGEFGDAVPEGPAGGALARLLAEKLLALDLPARAIPVLQGLMQAAPAGEPRAEFGARLAQQLLDGGAAGAAGDALAASDAPGLPAALAESRALLQARVKAGTGDMAGAAAQLRAIGTAAADDLRAALLQGAGDWRGSLAALADLAAKRVPAEGPLSEASQDILVRQAGAAVQVPDPAALRVLARSAGRLTGNRREVFRLLTEAPVTGTGDLRRSGQELASAQAVAQRLQAADAR